MRRRALRLGPLAAVAALLVALPIAGLTETGAERSLKVRLGLIDLPVGCWDSSPSPGWAAGPKLPADRDEPRGVAIGDTVYLAGGILAITDFGKPSDVPGVSERVEVLASRQLTAFDTRTGRYEELPPLPRRLNHVGFVAHEGQLYVVGGHGDFLVGADVRAELHRYSPATRRWTQLASMPTARGGVGAAVLDGKLVVIGGLVPGRVLRTVEAYDFERDRWETLPPMLQPREHVMTAVVGDRLYAIGGRELRDNSLSSVERYDPGRRRWEVVSRLPIPTGGGDAVVFDGRIVVMGGGDDLERTVTPAVQRFDPRTGAWDRLPDMRSPRHGFASAVVGDEVWTFGGSNCALFSSVDTVDVLRPREVS